MTNLTTMFKDQRWRRYRTDETSPHMLYVATNGNGDKVAALVLRRTHVDGDWALSQSALDYVAGALRDGRITEGYVVLANKWNVVAHADAKEVLASMRPKGDPRSPPSGCCEHFCCRRSTASVRSAS
jgi:hypothetical protein